MRHRKAGVKLNMTSSHRQAMFRNMVTSLFKYDRIKTTDAKAKELRRWADHMITLAKRGDLHARRQAMSVIREKNVVHKLFEEASERFGSVAGGYTRLVKLGRRPGDSAPVSLIELITQESRDKKKKPAKKAKPTAAPKAKEKAVAKDAAGAVEVTPAVPDADAADVVEAATEDAPEEKTQVAADPEETSGPAEAVDAQADEAVPEKAETEAAAAEEQKGSKDKSE
ncbi:MAG: 50S ribosomal protein L17 [Deltaproteobacteria bacterium]|nr:50S ribosomal protein L17 [Deltaproteobacteria bacterium]